MAGADRGGLESSVLDAAGGVDGVTVEPPIPTLAARTFFFLTAARLAVVPKLTPAPAGKEVLL